VKWESLVIAEMLFTATAEETVWTMVGGAVVEVVSMTDVVTDVVSPMVVVVLPMAVEVPSIIGSGSGKEKAIGPGSGSCTVPTHLHPFSAIHAA